jgi:tRNA(fMet)-specific endonuclease VapC
MNGNNIALDTNQAIAILNGRIAEEDLAAHAAQWCIPVTVAGELIYGSLNSGRHADNLKNVLKLVSRRRILNTTFKTAEIYTNIPHSLKKQGRPIPENDVWIAAICLEMDMPLATEDVHFQHVTGLRTLLL